MCHRLPGNGRRSRRRRCVPLRRCFFTRPAPGSARFPPAVAELDAVFLSPLLVEVPPVAIEVFLAIQLPHPLERLPGNSLRAGTPFVTILKSVVAMLFVALPPPSQAPVARSQNLSRVPPFRPACHGSQHYFWHLHHPLHFRGGDRGIGCFHLPASPAACFHADRSCATWTGQITC